ncbi:MAG: undecaprenyl/decaprenyl-phosphate alpha-N-acetylglucosaminyl 1-phosphate transferase [Acidobacteria bacterium]|nr:undecaprenyl/decaprenyl-phosphate alpha-N-acetylglucosaminyl 1-phosphate transferase [Acidobacteriota bacterium]
MAFALKASVAWQIEAGLRPSGDGGKLLTPFYLGIFLVSLLFSFVLTRYIRNWAVARGWVAPPGPQRHLHSRPLPRIGGIAIMASFLAALVAALGLNFWNPGLAWGASPQSLLTILVPGFLVFSLGVYDDLHGASVYLKFGVQALAAAMLYAGGLRILDLPVLFGDHHFSWMISLPLTILWVLAITNAFNLIDGLDGLAAGSALFSTTVVFVAALVSQTPMVPLMTLALAGAVLGFLRYNFNPATIFLGDSGSLFIGFMLSALALQGAQKAPTLIAVAIPMVSFGLPILETTLSVLRRFISGRPVFTADREHIHHKLLERGMSQRQAVIVLYGVSAVFAMLSLFLLWPTGSTLGLVLAVLGVGVWVGVQHLNYLEFGELRRIAQRTMGQRQVFVNNLAIRRAIEELKVAQSYDQLGRILTAAFEGNDFDVFELRLQATPVQLPEIPGLQLIVEHGKPPRLRWRKPGTYAHAMVSAWSLNLDLVTSTHRRCGTLAIYRLYSQRDLQLDINLLTSVFPVALAEALDRAVVAQSVELAAQAENPVLAAAQAG